jgi:hypothetical protein
MLSELSEIEYKETFEGKMSDVTEIAEEQVNIWEYVDELVFKNKMLKSVSEDGIVENVYRSQGNKFEHIIIPLERENYKLVIIIDCWKAKIKGHYFLDLDKVYGN